MIVLWLASTALGWEGLGATWPDEAMPVRWVIAEPIGGGLDRDEAIAAIQAGVQVWNDADCGVSFVYDGLVSDAGFGGTVDGRNAIFLLDEGWPSDPALLADQAIALQGSTLVEADIALNAQHFTFVTSGSDGITTFDLQGTIAHEWSHVAGLWHTDDPDASASSSMNGREEARDLAEDDIAGLCALYAGDPGAVGDACADNTDCASDLFCLDDEGDRYCSGTCAADADCPEGYACTETADAAVCATAAPGCGCTQARARPGLWPLLLLILAVGPRAAAGPFAATRRRGSPAG